ncbi:hypothetical protein [Pseudomonas sp. MONT-RG-20F-20-E-7-02]|uniref:hypothetical protein n=1 Tax=Pseudomonas sp. MONT-RG-20F-20-E-7-02 TaxID=2914979 RepID=UPI001F5866DF|nr:hypothetical protein [Pseudomonas sp. MONT-RG-20F-20-E-7-02]
MTIPKGYKLVPVEPTEEMLVVMHDRILIGVNFKKREASILNDKEWWAAVLAAAKTPPQPIYDEAKERELFEAYHAIESGLEGTDLETEFDRKDDGEYVYMMAADGWKYWKACAQSRAKAGELGHE